MALLLKRRDEVKPDDLPYIETAYFTAVNVQSERHVTFSRIMNLKRMLYEVDESPNMWGREERQWRRLLELIERYEVVLVGGRSDLPLSPVFRWKADETQPQGGSWENASHNYMDRTPLDWLLHRVHASHGGAMQAAAAVAAAVVAGAATAVAEHLRTPAEEKRYPLSTALTYDPVQKAVSAAPVLSARFKWENEVTGPESRRSGEIKKTDPVYSEVRGRELRAGDYRLEFQNAVLDTRAIKPPRS